MAARSHRRGRPSVLILETLLFGRLRPRVRGDPDGRAAKKLGTRPAALKLTTKGPALTSRAGNENNPSPLAGRTSDYPATFEFRACALLSEWPRSRIFRPTSCSTCATEVSRYAGEFTHPRPNRPDEREKTVSSPKNRAAACSLSFVRRAPKGGDVPRKLRSDQRYASPSCCFPNRSPSKSPPPAAPFPRLPCPPPANCSAVARPALQRRSGRNPLLGLRARKSHGHGSGARARRTASSRGPAQWGCARCSQLPTREEFFGKVGYAVVHKGNAAPDKNLGRLSNCSGACTEPCETAMAVEYPPRPNEPDPSRRHLFRASATPTAYFTAGSIPSYTCALSRTAPLVPRRRIKVAFALSLTRTGFLRPACGILTDRWDSHFYTSIPRSILRADFRAALPPFTARRPLIWSVYIPKPPQRSTFQLILKTSSASLWAPGASLAVSNFVSGYRSFVNCTPPRPWLPPSRLRFMTARQRHRRHRAADRKALKSATSGHRRGHSGRNPVDEPGAATRVRDINGNVIVVPNSQFQGKHPQPLRAHERARHHHHVGPNTAIRPPRKDALHAGRAEVPQCNVSPPPGFSRGVLRFPRSTTRSRSDRPPHHQGNLRRDLHEDLYRFHARAFISPFPAHPALSQRPEDDDLRRA